MPAMLRRLVAVPFLAAIAACATPKPTVMTVPSQGANSFRHEIVTKDGQPHGAATGWHVTGQLAYRGTFFEGKRHGDFTYFHPNGNWLRLERYVHGELVLTTTDLKEAMTDALPAIDPEVAEEKDDTRPDDLDPWWSRVGELRVPGFPEMTALSNRSGIEARLSMHQIRREGQTTESSRRQVSFAQQLGRLGLEEWGLYGTGVFPKVEGSVLLDPADGRSSLEVGARWMAPNRRLALRIGGMFNGSNDDQEGHLVARDTLAQRPSDAIGSYPNTSALRTQATYVGQYRVVNYRIDSGLDMAWERGRSAEQNPAVSPIFLARLDAGVGFATDLFGLAAQLSSAVPLRGDEVDGPLLTASVSAQLRGSWAWPAISFILPLTGNDTRVGIALSLAKHFSLL